MMRWDIINALIEKNNYKSYLEIGYYKGWSFDQIRCDNKRAIDPNPCKTPEQEAALSEKNIIETIPISENLMKFNYISKTTSDKFFAGMDQYPDDIITEWDLIFIDGLHKAEQVYKDIKNAIKHLSSGGTIVMHDCNPPKYEHTTTGIDGCWTGDTYKAVLKFRDEEFEDWDFNCVDTDWGVGILRKRPERLDTLVSFLSGFSFYKPDWDFFNKRRKDLLSIITIDQFKNKYL